MIRYFLIFFLTFLISCAFSQNKVVLSGGVFQNRFLIENAERLLKENNFEVYTHSKVPSNDGGVALGQLAIAAKRRELESSKVHKV